MQEAFPDHRHHWRVVQAVPALPPGEVHVWRSCVDQSITTAALGLVNEEELRRSERFRFEADRRRYLVSRAALRRLLATYLAADPRELRFALGSHGKPALAPSAAGSEMRFNLSHSGNVVLLAFAVGVEVGVDVEVCRGEIEAGDIAHRFFSVDEVAFLKALPGSQRTEGFFDLWTRKEACVKALGAGLSLDLKSFSVVEGSEDGATEPAVVRFRQGSHLELHGLPPIAGYRAALACCKLGLRPLYFGAEAAAFG